MNEEERKKKNEKYWAEHNEKFKIKATKENPNAVAIGCNLDPNAHVKDRPARRYV